MSKGHEDIHGCNVPQFINRAIDTYVDYRYQQLDFDCFQIDPIL